jgi:hypothetical protein
MEQETEEMSFDLNEMSKEDLINFIMFAHKNNYTINEALVKSLEQIINQINLEENK